MLLYLVLGTVFTSVDCSVVVYNTRDLIGCYDHVTTTIYVIICMCICPFKFTCLFIFQAEPKKPAAPPPAVSKPPPPSTNKAPPPGQ